MDYYELIEDKKDEEFSKNGLKYEEIKRLLDIVLKKINIYLKKWS